MFWKLSVLAAAFVGLMAGNLPADDGAASRDGSAAVAARSSDAPQPSDKELIKRQEICPVTGQPLGSMGEPVKVMVKDRAVFICCAGCKKKLLANPDKYLKKLDERKKGGK